ncbi:MAG: hypothetical protein GXY83_26115 [Rhodopirellula sp.]|nr:hypothetical protein [Rhodopirellula sp.]
MPKDRAVTFNGDDLGALCRADDFGDLVGIQVDDGNPRDLVAEIHTPPLFALGISPLPIRWNRPLRHGIED